jgi:hypothetical protein
MPSSVGGDRPFGVACLFLPRGQLFPKYGTNGQTVASEVKASGELTPGLASGSLWHKLEPEG